MMIRFILVLALLTLGAAPAQAAPEPSDRTGDTYLRHSVDRLGATGGAWAVVRGGEISHVGVTGTDGEGRPVTAGTAYLVGSVSKPLLATTVVSLADAGRLDLDTPVVEALPEVRRIPGAEAITPRHLLEHTSGLPFGADHLDRGDKGRTARSVVADLDVALGSKPGERYTYSSIGYVILTAWVEAVMKQPLTSLYAATPGIGDVTRPATAGKRGPWMPTMRTTPDPAGLGYGYAAMSVTQLARFARASLADEDRLKKMTDVQPEETRTLTGLGWRVDHVKNGGTRVWHTGTVPGSFSAVYLLPERGLAVVVVLNRSGVLDEDRLYDASSTLLTIADGGLGTLPGNGWTLPVLVGGLVLVGVVGAVLGRRRGVLRWLGLGLGVLLLAGPVIAPLVMGYPVRYGLLWAPEVVAAMAVAGLIALVAGLVPRRGRRAVQTA